MARTGDLIKTVSDLHLLQLLSADEFFPSRLRLSISSSINTNRVLFICDADDVGRSGGSVMDLSRRCRVVGLGRG